MFYRCVSLGEAILKQLNHTVNLLFLIIFLDLLLNPVDQPFQIIRAKHNTAAILFIMKSFTTKCFATVHCAVVFASKRNPLFAFLFRQKIEVMRHISRITVSIIPNTGELDAVDFHDFLPLLVKVITV